MIGGRGRNSARVKIEDKTPERLEICGFESRPVATFPTEPAMKKFAYTPFLDILFDRTAEVKTILPSGKEVVNIDDAPPVLRMDTPDGMRLYQSTPDGMVEIKGDEVISALIKDFAGATPSKRPPKF